MIFSRLLGLSVLSAALVAGCGGGGDGVSSPPAATTSTGQLSNSPIDGASYSGMPSGTMGVTANGGLYDFVEGDTITFNIAGLEVDVPAGNRVTPQVIAEALVPENAMGAETLRQNVLLNLATLFQTLDNDGDSENGSIVIREGALLGNLAALLANLDDEPATFQTEFQMALDMSEGVRDDGVINPEPVGQTEALLRFYRNELQGNWRLVNVQEEGTTTDSSDNFQVLLSFDAGNPSTTTSGAINSFVFSEYDVADSFTTVGVGTLNYDDVENTFTFTTLPRMLSPNITDSTTDPDGALIGTTVELNGTNLVLNIDDEGTAIVATFERFNNQKDSLVGTWYEILPFSENSVQPTVQAPAPNGSVQFGENVASVFYYFLSSSRLMISTTDLPPNGDGDERNGVLVADYRVTNNQLFFDTILIDSISTDELMPQFSTGLQATISATSMNNDTRRTISSEGETDDIYRILSLSERVGDFVQAVEPVESAESAQ